MKVIALHRLPFREDGFKHDLESLVDCDAETRSELENQVRENWNNAWIIVVESDANQEIDFGLFCHPRPGPNAQSAWLECEMESVNGNRRAAFFMHYLNPDSSLWYGDQKLALPVVTVAPEEIVQILDYSSPD